MKNNHINKKIKYVSFSNKKHSSDTKELMSLVRKGTGIGEKNSQFGTCWITDGFENKKVKKEDAIPEGWKLGRTLPKKYF